MVFSLFFMACEEEEARFVEGVVPEISNIEGTIFNLTDVSNTSVSFDLNTIGVPVNSVDAYINYNGGASSQIGTYSTFPSNITVTATEAAAATGVNTSDIMIGDVFQVSFVCNTQDGRALKSNVTMDIVGSCPSALEGTYSVFTTYGYHDYLPDYAETTMELTISRLENGNYVSTDFSGGLYGSGPYSVEYNTGPLDAVEFSEVCGEIMWSGQSDPWGDLVMTAGGVNQVDPATGVITISWTANAYGENGVSVYTPL